MTASKRALKEEVGGLSLLGNLMMVEMQKVKVKRSRDEARTRSRNEEINETGVVRSTREDEVELKNN
eukprot:CAMPEP_0194116706 /NCGR_PEP_ID=MMETSP0150-20130528/28301_1 /TAXON_ID=122233 /ORGANISM="Chaetoceros debilis, Strain MM31A-1" /LENGTH=66 /DNA_ID=CAMNT_0038807491 /DNA_START=147 /DNA_END=347 /DNA_ORIENTATION=+